MDLVLFTVAFVGMLFSGELTFKAMDSDSAVDVVKGIAGEDVQILNVVCWMNTPNTVKAHMSVIVYQ